MWRDVAALTATNGVHPLSAGPPWVAQVSAVRGHTHRGVVLLSTARVVGKVAGRGQTVDLRRRVAHIRPCPASVHGHHPATVVAIDHAGGVAWIDPQVVVIGVRFGNRLERLATVRRFHQPEVENVDCAAIHGIGLHALEVEGTLPQVPMIVDECPGRTSVVGSIETAMLGLDVGPDSAGIGTGYGDGNLP